MLLLIKKKLCTMLSIETEKLYYKLFDYGFRVLVFLLVTIIIIIIIIFNLFNVDKLTYIFDIWE